MYVKRRLLIWSVLARAVSNSEKFRSKILYCQRYELCSSRLWRGAAREHSPGKRIKAQVQKSGWWEESTVHAL